MSGGKRRFHYRFAFSRIAILLFALCGLFSGCGGQAQEDIIAVVGERQVTAEDLRAFVLNLLPGLYTDKQGQEARKDYLQSLLDQQLLLLEARVQGLDSDPLLRGKLQVKKRDYLANLYRQREILPQVQVTEEEIRRVFDDQGLARERFLTAILVQTEEEARQLQAQIENGAVFGELAQEYSLDPRSAQRGGELGFVNRAMAAQLGIPEALFASLPARTVSPPLPRGQTFHLVRFLDERTVDLQTQQATIRMQLLREKRKEREERQVELLAYERELAMSDRGLTVLKSQVKSLAEKGLQLSAAERETPLFAYEKGSITVQDYIEVLRARRIKNTKALLDSSFISAIARWFILPNLMFMEAARDAGITELPEVIQWEKKMADDLLLKTLQQREVSDRVSIDEEEVRRYVRENPDKFLTTRQICFDELIVPGEEKARQLENEITSADSLIQVAQKHKLPVRSRNADGLVCMTRQNRSVYPQLWEALETARIGALGGPVRTHEGYAFFKVVRRHEPQPEPFEKARKRAHAVLQGRAEQARFGEWLLQLREKYQDQVTIHPDRLEQALPEAMLAGLVRQAGEKN